MDTNNSGKYNYSRPDDHTIKYNPGFGLENHKIGDFNNYQPKIMGGNYNPGGYNYIHKPVDFQKSDPLKISDDMNKKVELDQDGRVKKITYYYPYNPNSGYNYNKELIEDTNTKKDSLQENVNHDLKIDKHTVTDMFSSEQFKVLTAKLLKIHETPSPEPKPVDPNPQLLDVPALDMSNGNSWRVKSWKPTPPPGPDPMGFLVSASFVGNKKKFNEISSKCQIEKTVWSDPFFPANGHSVYGFGDCQYYTRDE